MEKFDCILIIDDDSISNYLTKRLLEYNMEMATILHTSVNGEEGLQFIRQYFEKNGVLPEIIFLDISMPVCDGFEFVERFKVLYPEKGEVHIVVLTTSSSNEDMSKMKDLGIRHYLNKPLNQEKLTLLFNKLKKKDII